MSKTINEQSTNKVNIIGKLLDCTFRNGKTKDGRAYESANFTVRVNQQVNGIMEVDEIPCSMFATQLTNSGQPHPGYRSLQELKALDTIQSVGETGAARIKITAGNLRENNFVTKSGLLVTSWQLSTPFLGQAPASATDIASFNEDIFIMDMHDEMDREGDATGRLIIKGGIVQYGGMLDVIEFIVEGSDCIDYVSRNWNSNDTVNVGGRIRVTSKEVKSSAENSSWGEDLPETSTQFVKELIITRGSETAFDEDFSYDPVEIRKAFNERKARIEQLQINATQPAKKAETAAASKYSWE